MSALWSAALTDLHDRRMRQSSRLRDGSQRGTLSPHLAHQFVPTRDGCPRLAGSLSEVVCRGHGLISTPRISKTRKASANFSACRLLAKWTAKATTVSVSQVVKNAWRSVLLVAVVFVMSLVNHVSRDLSTQFPRFFKKSSWRPCPLTAVLGRSETRCLPPPPVVGDTSEGDLNRP